ncbi:Phosphotransferase enzyme family protein [Thalassovita litoralis]|jgi:aminoglycoside phosphotransferase (APT) family kinase protein|uniref:Phosphotransferase enzyme family protein n=1 Tax=Thalassovita litoralis TaxID=1010611 RepID=A0A521FSW2_9RHOB|nr:aminoglycoside phosphotransferase family protein [Thalassovita litoralis]SMO99216.1 Phosphotransferase enzyme family protein [Thalassovita litoralis]
MTPDPELQFLLLRDGLIGPDLSWQPLHGGQTNSLWRVGDRVVKCFAAQDGNPRFPNDPGQEITMLRYLSGQAIAPRLLGRADHLGMTCLVYEHLAGKSWHQDAAQVGALLRRVHSLPAPNGLRVLPGGSDAVFQQVQSILPDLPVDLAARLNRKRPTHSVPASQVRVLLHGDVVPGNIVVAPQGARLIDWQCPAQGDPAEDLAIFLSPAMQLIYRGGPLSDQERADFLVAYDDPAVCARVQAMQPWHHWAMAAYCGWKAARGAQNYAQAMALELAEL